MGIETAERQRTNKTREMASAQAKPLDDIISKMSVLAQAKPVIISAPASNNLYSNFPSGDTKEMCDASDNMSAPAKLAHAQSEGHLRKQLEAGRLDRTRSACGAQQDFKMSHIEDENLINKQNASNQMRQAAVMVALASQQSKQRLSATERLAMTAKRPQQANSQSPPHNGQQQQVGLPNGVHQDQPPLPPPIPPHQNLQHHKAPPPPVPTHQQHKPTPPTKPAATATATSQHPVAGHTQNVSKPTASMPTLETLLAVQRQLQRHTRQNLTSTNRPQDLVKPAAQLVAGAAPKQVISEGAKKEPRANDDDQGQFFSKQFPNLSKLPSKAKEQNNYVTSIQESYDKELPASISPSSYTNSSPSDESQLNSLESQSSPSTSLVSLPPPPPPISSYLQQYDEATNHHQPNRDESKSGSPTTDSSSVASDVQSIRHFPTVPIKHHPVNNPPSKTTQPIEASQQTASKTVRPPLLAPRPERLAGALATKMQTVSQHVQQAPSTQQAPAPNWARSSEAPAFPPPPATFAPPPPPPVSQEHHPAGGFDEPDCANLRFPTPPPPELLFDDGLGGGEPKSSGKESGAHGDEEDDEDFQCRIPTPPQKSMSFVSFQDLSTCQPARQIDHFFIANSANSQHQKAFFNSSSFSVPMTGELNRPASRLDTEPAPLLFHQRPHRQHHEQPQQQQQQQQEQQQQPPKPQEKQAANLSELSAPQLTVCVSDDDARLANSNGLLATGARHPYHFAAEAGHRGRHLMLNAMVAPSSSSPSSSSDGDGDGHSSNSSSSTSGVPSSIDSPSLKSETDFNYGASSRAASAGAPQLGSGPIIGCAGSRPAASIMLMGELQNQHANTAQLMRKQQNVKNSFVGHQFDPAAAARFQAQPALEKFNAPRPPPQHVMQAPRQQPSQRRNSNSSINSSSTVTSGSGSVTGSTTTSSANKPNKLPRPALKQKKSVSFSDRVELVACAEEQSETHLPNPLLARVLAAQNASKGIVS